MTRLRTPFRRLHGFRILGAILLVMISWTASNAEEPIFKNVTYLSRIAINYPYGDGKGLIRGGYLYVLNQGHLEIYDIHDPTKPTLVSSTSVPLTGLNDIELHGTRVFIAGWDDNDHRSIGSPGIFIYDVSNPKSTKCLASFIDHEGIGRATTVVTDGTKAYLNTECSYIIALNVSNPEEIHVESIDKMLEGPFWGLDLHGKYLYGCKWFTIDIFDRSSASDIIHKAEISGTGGSEAVFNGNEYMIIDTDHLTCLNFDDPLNPRQISSTYIGRMADGIEYDNNLVFTSYISCKYGYDRSCLRIYDIADPARVSLVAEVHGNLGSNASENIDAENGLIYCGGYLMRLDLHDTLKISNISRHRYLTNFLNQKNYLYTDRDYKFTAPSPQSSYTNQTYIQTLNDDKNSQGDSFLSFTIDRPTTVYVAYDERATKLPEWLSSWSATSMRLTTTDTSRRLYSKHYPAGTVTLGGNRGVGDQTTDNISMYTVLFQPDIINNVQGWADYE